MKKNNIGKIVGFTMIMLSVVVSSCTKEEAAGANSEANARMDNDLAISQWYLYQMDAMNAVAPDQYNFNKIDYTPAQVIDIQKTEIRKAFAQQEKAGNIKVWAEAQFKAFHALGGREENNDQPIDLSRVENLEDLLDKQEKVLNKML